MPATLRSLAPLALVLAIACAAFLTGITWGLPSRNIDPYLFGNQTHWTGQQILELAPSDTGQLGADVDSNPITNRTAPVLLNATDAQRAEIIQRYRLFSYQPDEFITFKSLSRIREFKGDPRLYQYGGLWIYPVGVLIKIFANPVPDRAYYLDHPDVFARFYVVARAYSALWGLVAVAAIYSITRRLTASTLLAVCAGVAFAFMPVVVTMAHEAKPHLGGLALTLCAVVAGCKFVDTGRPRYAIFAGALCGCAFGIVISSLLSFAILPMMILCRRDRWIYLLQATAAGVVAYFLFNPFVLINLVTNRAVLASNLGNSTAMYSLSTGGFRNALMLVIEGASPILFIAGALGLITLAFTTFQRRSNKSIESTGGAVTSPSPPASPPASAAWMLLAPAGVVMLQFLLLADGKPPEYARFALLPITFLLVGSFTAIARLINPRARAALAIAVTLLTIPFGCVYIRAFHRDTQPQTSRTLAAEQLRAQLSQSNRTITLTAEPAPYIAPPIDLFTNQLILTPTSVPATLRLDQPASPAPISWADARFQVVATSQGR